VNYAFQRPLGVASKRDHQPVVPDGDEFVPERFLGCLPLKNLTEFIMEPLTQLTNLFSNSRKRRTCPIFDMATPVNSAADLLFQLQKRLEIVQQCGQPAVPWFTTAHQLVEGAGRFCRLGYIQKLGRRQNFPAAPEPADNRLQLVDTTKREWIAYLQVFLEFGYLVKPKLDLLSVSARTHLRRGLPSRVSEGE
jgi:hypothetical protein